LKKMKSYALFLCLSQIVFCSSTPNRAMPDLTKEEFLENHEKFTGFLDNVHVITEAEDRSGESRPLEDVVNPSQGNCAHPKDLDCKLDSFSCLDPNHVDDPRCIPEVPNADSKTHDAFDEFADFEDVDTVPGDLDMAVKDVPEVPEPVDEKVEDMIENEESTTPRPAPEMVNASVPKRPTPTTTKSPKVRMNSTKMPEENRTVVEDILMEEEDDDEDDKDEEDEEDATQFTKEADDRSSANSIIIQDEVEEVQEVFHEPNAKPKGGSPLMNFFNNLFG